MHVVWHSAEAIPRTPCAGPCGVPLIATFPTALASVRSSTVRHHVSKTQAAVSPMYLNFPTDPAGDPTDLDGSRLK